MPLPSVFQGVQARPHTLQTLPQASKATTLTATATCPCHLFFRGFKSAVCLASSPPNASNPPAGLQGNNSYLITATTCPCHLFFRGSRLPFAWPQTPQTLPTLPQASKATTLTATTCPCRGSRLPFARPQTPQTLPTLPQASKATTLTATTTCPCHLFFRGFKTAVCPPSNPPNPPAGLQGNNSYSYMPLPSVFQGVHDKFAWPQTLQTLPQASKATTLTATATTSRLAFARPQTPQTLPALPQASKATTLTATTCPCHLGFKPAVCPASNPPNASNPPAGLQGNNSYSYYYMPLPSVFQGVQDCRLPALKPPKPSRKRPRQQLLQLHAPAICFSGGSRQVCLASNPPNASAGFQGNNSYSYTVATTCPCHLFFRGFKTAVCPASNPPNASNPPAGLQGNNPDLTATILYTCPCHLFFSGGSRLPFARPQTPQTLPQASRATTLTATCPCHRFYPPTPALAKAGAAAWDHRRCGTCFVTAMALTFQQQLLVCVCGLPRFKRLKRAAAAPTTKPSRRPFQGNSRSYTPQTMLQTLPHAFPRQLSQLQAPDKRFKRAAAAPTTKPSRRLFQGNPRSYTPQTMLQTLPRNYRLPDLKPLKPLKPSRRPFQGNSRSFPQASNFRRPFQSNSRSYRPQPSVFKGVQDRLQAALPAFKPLQAPAICFKGVQDCRLPGLKPFKSLKTSRGPFQGNSRSFPQSSKATLAATRPRQCFTRFRSLSKATLAATGPSHLFLRAFKTAFKLLCPPSNRYRPQLSVFKGVQDCRLPGLALQTPQTLRRPFQGNSRSFPQAFPRQLSATRACACDSQIFFLQDFLKGL